MCPIGIRFSSHRQQLARNALCPGQPGQRLRYRRRVVARNGINPLWRISTGKIPHRSKPPAAMIVGRRREQNGQCLASTGKGLSYLGQASGMEKGCSVECAARQSLDTHYFLHVLQRRSR